MNIYEKISKIMGEVQSLKKDGKVSYKSTRYNFLSGAKTTQVFRQKLVENKLVLLPIKARDEKTGTTTTGHYVYRLLNAENPEEFIDLETTGQGHDSADKGSGKASTYAYKYLLWRTFAVETNDDPDEICSDEISDTKKQPTIPELQSQIKQAEKSLGLDKDEITTNRSQYIGDPKMAQLSDYELYLKTLRSWIETK